MYRLGFDNEKYLTLQSQRIKKRIEQFGGKLYLEFGGKLFDDHHASRVLPGFKPDSKIKMLLQLKEQAEIVIVTVSYTHLEHRSVSDPPGLWGQHHGAYQNAQPPACLLYTSRCV